jgi:hypothetical protein
MCPSTWGSRWDDLPVAGAQRGAACDAAGQAPAIRPGVGGTMGARAGGARRWPPSPVTRGTVAQGRCAALARPDAGGLPPGPVHRPGRGEAEDRGVRVDPVGRDGTPEAVDRGPVRQQIATNPAAKVRLPSPSVVIFGSSPLTRSRTWFATPETKALRRGPGVHRAAVRRARRAAGQARRPRPAPAHHRRERHRGRRQAQLDHAQDALHAIGAVPAQPARADPVAVRGQGAGGPRVHLARGRAAASEQLGAPGVRPRLQGARAQGEPARPAAHRGPPGHPAGRQREGRAAHVGARLGRDDAGCLRRIVQRRPGLGCRRARSSCATHVPQRFFSARPQFPPGS